MGAILGLVLTHHPPPVPTDDHMADIVRRTPADPAMAAGRQDVLDGFCLADALAESGRTWSPFRDTDVVNPNRCFIAFEEGAR